MSDLKAKHISDRVKMVNRVFERYKSAGRYKQEQYHDFCRFAKNKSESELLRILSLHRKQPTKRWY